MNRIDFMSRLALLLSDIPESEREEAIVYYNDYLNDAGVENEEEVLADLGTPEQLAASIKDGLREGSITQGEFSENGYQENGGKTENEVASRSYAERIDEVGEADRADDGTWRQSRSSAYHGGSYQEGTWKRGQGQSSASQNGGPRQENAGRQSSRSAGGEEDLDRRYRKGRKKGMSGGMIALIVILCILTSPITIPLVFVLGLVLFILAVVLIPIFLLCLFLGVICIVAGICSFFGSVVDLFTFPAGAVLGIGMSLVTIGLGILLTLGIGWVLSKVFPKAFCKVVDFFGGLFHKKGGNEV